jgi:hypothetical protein
MGYVDRHLGPGEQVVFRTRLHPVVFTGSLTFALFVAGATALIIARNELAPATIRWLLLAAVATIVVSGAPTALRWWASDFAVTNCRLLARVGLRAADVVEVAGPAPNAVTVQQTLAGRLLGYGTVRLAAGGGSAEVFPRVARAGALREAFLRETRAGAATRAR